MQAMQAELLLGVAPHDRNIDLGLAHVGRHLDARYRHIMHARIAQLGQDRHAHHLANGGGGFEEASIGHGIGGMNGMSVEKTEWMVNAAVSFTLPRPLPEREGGFSRSRLWRVRPRSAGQNVRAISSIL